MRLLLTNDDGVYAPGIAELRRVLSQHDDLEVSTVAPERERSAMSHAITLHKPLHIKSVEIAGGRGPVWSVNGTPADCTKLGVLALMEDKPDLIISGINRGANLGMDILYSGTVSAAIEGYLMNIPSLAVSLDTHDEKADFQPAAEFIVRLIRILEKHGMPEQMLLNINIPDLPEDKRSGVRVTRMGMRYYKSKLVARQDPLGRTYYWLAGEVYQRESEPETDVGALQRGYISITPIHFQLTDESMMQKLQSWTKLL